MKHISFKIIILCIFLPPVLYIFSVQSIESYLQKRYTKEIEKIYIGDTRPLFKGSIRLKDAVNSNIDRYLRNKKLKFWGVIPQVMVATRQGAILYPEEFGEEKDAPLVANELNIASENYSLLNEGLLLTVDTKLGYHTPISIGLLAFYSLLFVSGLYLYYRSGVKKAEREEMEKAREIERLTRTEKEYIERLKNLGEEKETLSAELEQIRERFLDEKEKASRAEDEILEEMLALEEKIKENIAVQKKKQEEIDSLKEKIESYEKAGRKDGRQKPRALDTLHKRFKALYKNITISERAVSGFTGLTEELRIKSEEIIHQLNENPDLVSVKRKVFGKKNQATVLEVLFAYNGRLYFRRTHDNRVEVLAIGTKNTQVKDLEFLGKV